MPDADLKRFERGLNQTLAGGLKLCLAMHESVIAVRQIERLQQLGPRAGRAVDSWRRAYIKASENAANAIDQLSERDQWPADGARDRRFEWQPAKDFRR